MIFLLQKYHKVAAEKLCHLYRSEKEKINMEEINKDSVLNEKMRDLSLAVEEAANTLCCSILEYRRNGGMYD